MALNRINAYTTGTTEATTGYGYYLVYLCPMRREK